MLKPSQDKRCTRCGHSTAAHVDGLRCSLCGCNPAPPPAEQATLPFRSPLALGRYVAAKSRKKG
jgi:hypothetical protein